jgi:catechol 2,3-dioxygenase-like lactoylglutathione lyase family enzyme
MPSVSPSSSRRKRATQARRCSGVFDHVTIRVSDLAESGRFYRRVFELLDYPDEPYADERFHEWNDFSIARADGDKPVTRRLHAAFAARDREQVDAWWRALVDTGYPDDGPPGPRPQYGADYYGAFVLDPDGNSVEAVHDGPPRDDGGVIDHLWLRVRDVEASRRFYETIAPTAGFEVRRLPDRVQVRGAREAFSLLAGDPTENVHLAFPATDRATVEAFHRYALDAGYSNNGPPGERPQYHPGYYGAYVLDPDGHNVEVVFHDR